MSILGDRGILAAKDAKSAKGRGKEVGKGTRRTERTERMDGGGSAAERRGQNSEESRMDSGRMGDGSATGRRADGEDRGVHASAQDGRAREA